MERGRRQTKKCLLTAVFLIFAACTGWILVGALGHGIHDVDTNVLMSVSGENL